jgi:hypothetical protein
MRKRNFEGDYNLLFEKQREYEEHIKSYHNAQTQGDDNQPKETDDDNQEKVDNKD